MNLESDEQTLRDRGFGLEIGFGETPALIVVDMINAFTDPTTPLGAPMDDAIAATRAVLSAARKSRALVIFTTVSYELPQLEDAGIWAKKQRGIEFLVDGTSYVDVDARLEHRPNEALIKKKYASAFFGTDLITRLVVNGVDTLILVGCTTSGCIRATAVDGVQYGFRVAVVREAVADRIASAHTQSLVDLNAKYADVRSQQDVIDYLATYMTQRS